MKWVQKIIENYKTNTQIEESEEFNKYSILRIESKYPITSCCIILTIIYSKEKFMFLGIPYIFFILLMMEIFCLFYFFYQTQQLQQHILIKHFNYYTWYYGVIVLTFQNYCLISMGPKYLSIDYICGVLFQLFLTVQVRLHIKFTIFIFFLNLLQWEILILIFYFDYFLSSHQLLLALVSALTFWMIIIHKKHKLNDFKLTNSMITECKNLEIICEKLLFPVFITKNEDDLPILWQNKNAKSTISQLLDVNEDSPSFLSMFYNEYHQEILKSIKHLNSSKDYSKSMHLPFKVSENKVGIEYINSKDIFRKSKTFQVMQDNGVILNLKPETSDCKTKWIELKIASINWLNENCILLAINDISSFVDSMSIAKKIICWNNEKMYDALENFYSNFEKSLHLLHSIQDLAANRLAFLNYEEVLHFLADRYHTDYITFNFKNLFIFILVSCVGKNNLSSFEYSIDFHNDVSLTSFGPHRLIEHMLTLLVQIIVEEGGAKKLKAKVTTIREVDSEHIKILFKIKESSELSVNSFNGSPLNKKMIIEALMKDTFSKIEFNKCFIKILLQRLQGKLYAKQSKNGYILLELLFPLNSSYIPATPKSIANSSRFVHLNVDESVTNSTGDSSSQQNHVKLAWIKKLNNQHRLLFKKDVIVIPQTKEEVAEDDNHHHQEEEIEFTLPVIKPKNSRLCLKKGLSIISEVDFELFPQDSVIDTSQISDKQPISLIQTRTSEKNKLQATINEILNSTIKNSNSHIIAPFDFDEIMSINLQESKIILNIIEEMVSEFLTEIIQFEITKKSIIKKPLSPIGNVGKLAKQKSFMARSKTSKLFTYFQTNI